MQCEERHHDPNKVTPHHQHAAARAAGPPLMDDEGYRSLVRGPHDLRRPVKEGVPAELWGGFHHADPREETDPRGYGAGAELGATVVMTDHNEDAAVRRARDAMRQGVQLASPLPQPKPSRNMCLRIFCGSASAIFAPCYLCKTR